MPDTHALAAPAALLADPTRATMLLALMDGRALTAAELARAASVTPQTASAHLARLSEAGLLAVTPQGRHRYHRLASPAVARVIEDLMAMAPARPAPGRAPRTGPRDEVMRAARTCYDHLAGRLAVALADSLVAAGHIELSLDGGQVTPLGADFFDRLGLDLSAVPAGRVVCRPCLDWSERRPHIAGGLGRALCAHCLDRGWVRRVDRTRALTVTPLGGRALRETFGIVPG